MKLTATTLLSSVGTLVRLTERRKAVHVQPCEVVSACGKYADRTYDALITWAETRDACVEGKEPFTYFGIQPLDSMHGQFGATKLYHSPKEFGVQSVILLDARPQPKPSWKPWSPQPGNRAYDLMC